MSCARWDGLLLDDLYDLLPPGEREELAAHLAGCQHCRDEREALAGTLLAVRSLPEEAEPEADPGPLLAAAGAEATRLRARRGGPWARLRAAVHHLSLQPAAVTAGLVAITTAGLTWLLVDPSPRGEGLDAFVPASRSAEERPATRDAAVADAADAAVAGEAVAAEAVAAEAVAGEAVAGAADGAGGPRTAAPRSGGGGASPVPAARAQAPMPVSPAAVAAPTPRATPTAPTAGAASTPRVTPAIPAARSTSAEQATPAARATPAAKPAVAAPPPPVAGGAALLDEPAPLRALGLEAEADDVTVESLAREEPLPPPASPRRAAGDRDAGEAIAAHARDTAMAGEAAAEAERLFTAAERARIGARYDEALGLYLLVAERHPRHDRAPQALLAAVRLRKRAGDLAGARALVARLEDAYGDSPAAETARFLVDESP